MKPDNGNNQDNQKPENTLKISVNLDEFFHELSITEPTFVILDEFEIKKNLIVDQGHETNRIYDLTALETEINRRITDERNKNDSDTPWRTFVKNRSNGLLIILYTTAQNGQDAENQAFKFYNQMKKLGLTAVYIWCCDFGIPKFDKITDKINLEKTLKSEYSRLHSASVGLVDFENRLEITKNEPPISTGYEKLDQILDGGLYPGLYTFGADTSLGKSTFWLNIALNMSSRGHSVLYFSIEMSKFELTGRMLSRITYMLSQASKEPTHPQTERTLTTFEKVNGLNDADKELVFKSKEMFKHYAQNLYLYENIGEVYAETIQKEVIDFMTRTGNSQPPVVIVDYLQIIRSMDKYIDSNDKLKLDKNLFFFKKLSNDLRIPIVLISSLNRDSYKNWSRITMTSFKESGSIEYTSDVLIGMQLEKLARDGKLTPEQASEELSKDVREIDLIILKNRHGKRDVHTHFNYHTWFNNFSEIPGFDRYPTKSDITNTYSSKQRNRTDDDDETDYYV